MLSQEVDRARSVAAMLVVGVGSRHEDDADAGVSHLIEHLVFKGTRKYPGPGEISQAIEAVGGVVNASTDRELTVLTAKVPRDHAATALEVLGEMAFRPLLRAEDVAGERPVIVDEIRMYEDSPSDRIFSLFDALLFGRHPLGREIAGSPTSVRRIALRTLREHWSRWYRPEHVVLAAAGAVDHAALVEAGEAWWTDDREPAPRSLSVMRPPPDDTAARVRVSFRELGQGNLCLGMRGIPRTHPDRWALELASAVLGDGMSSRLFVELRERRSLVYEVSTFSSMLSDAGTFGVYAGFDPPRAEEVIRAIIDELERLVQQPVPEPELEKARAYTIGRLELRMEDTGAVASWLGHAEQLYPRVLTVDEVIEGFRGVTADDVLRVARAYLVPSRARLALLGPFRGGSRFERLLAA
ncbi:MAG: M16 family metallopeptidase [Candidatus Limnocylindria bacterium]